MSSAKAQVSRYRHLPMWRYATQLLVAAETVVRQFPRYHKCTLGDHLRRQAMDISLRMSRAAQCSDANQRARMVGQLVWGIESIKVTLQLTKEVETFASFARFQSMEELSNATSSSLALRCLLLNIGDGRQASETSTSAWVTKFELLVGCAQC